VFLCPLLDLLNLPTALTLSSLPKARLSLFCKLTLAEGSHRLLTCLTLLLFLWTSASSSQGRRAQRVRLRCFTHCRHFVGARMLPACMRCTSMVTAHCSSTFACLITCDARRSTGTRAGDAGRANSALQAHTGPTCGGELSISNGQRRMKPPLPWFCTVLATPVLHCPASRLARTVFGLFTGNSHLRLE
jgi:hypothetical protein